MRVPILWLKKYISFTSSPEKLAEDLTMSGTKLESLEKKDGEAVLDLEITSNRPDCLSVIGIAREVSSLIGKKINLPKISKLPAVSSKPSFKIEIEDKKGCPLYTARLIRGVSIKSSPSEIQKLVELSGVRAINNAVDATNFVLFEMGQPLHAFDFDKIEGGVIRVRRAAKNEKFLGLDGIEYTLDETILVIADAKKPIAIAGVMGGKLTEVTYSTKNILLESAFFDPILVRQSARKTKIATESGYRFERKIDVEGVESASARAMDLIHEWAGGDAAEYSKQSSLKKEKQKTVKVSFKNINAIIGMKISEKKISALLKNLGFGLKKSAGGLVIDVPSYRSDINEEADIVEEILRIEGFDKVKPAIPMTPYNEKFIQDKRPESVLELKKYLAALGLNEIMTYSFLSSKALQMSGYTDLSLAQRVRNPLSAEQEYLRPGLLPGALASVLFNVHRKADSLKFFEIGNCYKNGSEVTFLGILFYGNFENNWLRKSPVTFFDLKGLAENVLHGFFKLDDFSWEEGKSSSLDSALSLKVGGQDAGVAGEVKNTFLKQWDIPQSAFYLQINLQSVWQAGMQDTGKKVKAVSKYPVVRRDIAFLANKSVSVQSLLQAMKESAPILLKEARLFDEYSGKNIPEGKRSLAFSLSYQKETGTFTDEEIQGLQTTVGQALKNKFQVEFR